MNTYTQEDMARARKQGQVTDNGIAFDWWLAGPNGASFLLYREPKHTPDEIAAAKRHLRNTRDVVSIHIAEEAP